MGTRRVDRKVGGTMELGERGGDETCGSQRVVVEEGLKPQSGDGRESWRS